MIKTKIKTKAILIIFFLLCNIGLSIFYFWTQNIYTVEKTESFDISNLNYSFTDDSWYLFSPENANSTGIIIYSGAKVESLAYGNIADALQKKGYTVIIPDMPLNLGFFGINRADLIINKYNHIQNWYIGGHSLGGVAAAEYAKDHDDSLEGIFFLASYPSSDLSDSNLKGLNLYGDNDGLTLTTDIDKSISKYPSPTTHYLIKGGNHAGFAYYGPQKGDNEAIITTKEQQDIIIKQLLLWLEE